MRLCSNQVSISVSMLILSTVSIILPALATVASANYGSYRFSYCVADQRELTDSLAMIHKPSPNNGPATEAWQGCKRNEKMYRLSRYAANPCKSNAIASNDNVLMWVGHDCAHSDAWWNGAKGVPAHGGNPFLDKLVLGKTWHGGSQGVYAQKL